MHLQDSLSPQAQLEKSAAQMPIDSSNEMDRFRILIMTNYIKRNDPNIYQTLGAKISNFILFHLDRVDHQAHWVNKYDDTKILESFDLYTSEEQ